MMMHRRSRFGGAVKPGRAGGFTLIEVMIVVAIIAILAAVAVAAYGRYAYRARRADGQNLLQHIATAQERYYATFNQYTATASNIGYSNANPVSDKGYYQVTLALTNAGQGYTATAAPQNAQASDVCGSLVITYTGNKTFSGNESNGSCWGG